MYDPGEMRERQIKKLYYSIAEVSQITQLRPYVLRYWETEFSDLRPAKNRAGNRIYRKSDIRLLFLIKRLLYQEKYTIEGARQRLRYLKKNDGVQLNLSLEELRRDDLLFEIRKELADLLHFMEDEKEGQLQKDNAVQQEQI